MMEALTSVLQKLQQTSMELGEELTADIVLTLKEFDGPSLTHPGHALRLAALIIKEEEKGGSIEVIRK